MSAPALNPRHVRRGLGRKGFSLIELVIVVVIIGIIAAIAIPRMSRGSQGAADNAIASDLAILRSAVDLYTTEHNGLAPTVANFNAQLTGYTDISGNTGAKDTTHIYGPYLRTVPAIPSGPEKGKNGVAQTGSSPAAGTGIAWFYDGAGAVTVNLAGQDQSGVSYSSY